MTSQIIRTKYYDFLGGAIIPATTNYAPLVKKLTGNCTVAAVAGRAVLALDATNEAQNACLYADDNLAFDIDDLVQARFWVLASVATGATSKWRVGMASARADDPDTITASCLFGATGDDNIDCESDDGTNEQAATATGIALSTTLKKLVIDFSSTFAQQPPSSQLPGKANIKFSAEDASGVLKQVCENTRFNMNAHTTGLQPFVQIQKTSTAVGTLEVARIEIDYRAPA